MLESRERAAEASAYGRYHCQSLGRIRNANSIFISAVLNNLCDLIFGFALTEPIKRFERTARRRRREKMWCTNVLMRLIAAGMNR